MASVGGFRDLASPAARSYAGSAAMDKGITGNSPDSAIMRFFDRSEFQPALNPQLSRPIADQTLGDQFGSAKYELNIGLQIKNLIRLDSEGPWFTIILPLRQTDKLTFTGSIWKYNRRLPEPTPYHAPSPYVTEEFDEFYGQLQRYGESIRMEGDYFKTDEGQQNFFLKLSGIASDMVEGIRFDVMRALLRGIDENKRLYMNHTYSENPEDDIMLRVALFGALQKVPLVNGRLGQIVEILERVLREAGTTGPYEMIVPPQWGAYMKHVSQAPAAAVSYFMQGQNGEQFKIRDGPIPNAFDGRSRYWEYGDNTIETGSRPMRTLQRTVSILERAEMSFRYRGSDLYQMLSGLMAHDKNIGRSRNIYLYSATENKYVEIKIEDVIKGSGIVPESYKSDEPESGEYRGLVTEYKRLGANAIGRFFPELKEDVANQVNQSGHREAPSFLAWEAKGSDAGDFFIRVKYAGEKDENVSAPKDMLNAGEIACAHLAFSYGLANIGQHYLNAFNIRRQLQNASDSVAYWQAFYAVNIRTSLDGNVFVGSRLSESLDYDQYVERWGEQAYDNIGELATQPEGHYNIPSKTSYLAIAKLRIPPGCDCATGIRSIANIPEGSGWDRISAAVADHENALLSMVEQAKKFPDSELVNPLNRAPWEHNADMGAFCTAYTNGVSQFRAPLFLRAYTDLSTDSSDTAVSTLGIDFAANNRLSEPLYLNDNDDIGTRGHAPRRTRPRTAIDPVTASRATIDPVTGSLGDVDEDEDDIRDFPIDRVDRDTELLRLLKDYFIDVQDANEDIDIATEEDPTLNPGDTLPGYVYTVVKFLDKDVAAGSYARSYVRSVYISFAMLNETDDVVVSAIYDLAKSFLTTDIDMGIGIDEGTSILYIGTDGATSALVSVENVGTVARRGGRNYDSESTVYYDAGSGAFVAFGNIVDPAYTSLEEIEIVDILGELTASLPGGGTATGPLAAITPIRTDIGVDDSTLLFVMTRGLFGGVAAPGVPIRCALVLTPGMMKSRVITQANSPVLAGNKNTGYTTAYRNASPEVFARLRKSGLVHGVTSISSGVRSVSTGYNEIDTGVPRSQSHFGFNQVHARMVGMDDDGFFPSAASRPRSRSSRYYSDEDEEEDEIAMEVSSRMSRRGQTGSVSLLGSRQTGHSSRQGRNGGRNSYEHEYSESRIGVDRTQGHSYFGGPRRRGHQGRSRRRPFAHDLGAPSRSRFSESHGFDAGVRPGVSSAIDPSTGKLRRGFRMVRRFNGSNFVRSMFSVSDDPSSACTFFAIAFMMSRCDKMVHYEKLIKNRLHVDSNFLIHRIIDMHTESAILLKAGLGFSAVNNTDFVNANIAGTKSYHGHLTVHFGAFVTQPDHEMMMEDMRMCGYIGGKGKGVVMGPHQLSKNGVRLGSARPSLIVYAYPIATEDLSRFSSLTGRWEMEDVLPSNIPIQGALHPGVDWHERRWNWSGTVASERTDRSFFHKRGYTNPLIGFQGWQASYNLNEGNFYVSSFGEGHLAGGDYVGAVNVMNGNEAYFNYPKDPILV